ncbi:ABC transporter substrate-binding protein [Chromohalobacter israelensis]|jgi:NitT/TauT family transport system substrate-binding protein|uniref:ABC transporter substrate-binding protein n=1 Tax=Chromohalobacter israelensis TaxID=141390 RepID=UPI000D71859B|nr:ABC transporter substrate-binding protein [Chromohalobacter salexigens]MDO0945319.1 ABC transporter substrate-binding protein [Chromohalobacter salexigens]NWO55481.1 nitrate ABC transporter substrate-binding protein [Chromohalobacter salexigens]PWW42841.1 NitT/TauT family transport system substrate-binding protein [Chromohalobacter salexigens]
MRRLFHWIGALALTALLPSTALAQNDETTTLEVGYMPILPVAQLFVMEGAGWTDEAGLDLELTRFSSGPAMVQALASGKLDVMNFGIGPAMVARANGVPIKVLAASIQEQIGLIARGELANAFEGNDPAAAIAQFTETQGRKPKIATFPNGSVPYTVLRYWLEEQVGLDADAVDIVTMGASRVQQSLLAGAVDAASTLEPILSVVQQRDPDARVVARGNDMLPHQPGAVLAVREAVLEEHPEAIQALVAQHVRATEMLENDPAQAAPYVREFVGKRLIDEETVTAALSSPSSNYLADPHMIIDATRTMADFQRRIGTLKKPVDVDALFDTSVYDAVMSSTENAAP